MRFDMFNSLFPFKECRVAKSAPPTTLWNTVHDGTPPILNARWHHCWTVNLLYVLAQMIFAVKCSFMKWPGETLTGIMLCFIVLQTGILLLTECAGFVLRIYVKKADPLDLRRMLGFFMALPI
jgi:hypothetical protein